MGLLSLLSGGNRIRNNLDRIVGDVTAKIEAGQQEFAIVVDAYDFGRSTNELERLVDLVIEHVVPLGVTPLGLDVSPNGHAAWIRARATAPASPAVQTSVDHAPNAIVRQIVPPRLADGAWWAQSESVATGASVLDHPTGASVRDSSTWAEHVAYAHMQKGNVGVAFILYVIAVDRLRAERLEMGKTNHRTQDEDNGLMGRLGAALNELLDTHPNAPIVSWAARARVAMDALVAGLAEGDYDTAVLELSSKIIGSRVPGS